MNAHAVTPLALLIALALPSDLRAQHHDHATHKASAAKGKRGPVDQAQVQEGTPAARMRAADETAPTGHAGHEGHMPASAMPPGRSPAPPAAVDGDRGHHGHHSSAAAPQSKVDHGAPRHATSPRATPNAHADPLTGQGAEAHAGHARALAPKAGEHRGKDSGEVAQEHDHASMGHGAAQNDLPATSPPREPIPVITDADRAAAFPPDAQGHAAHDREPVTFLQLNRLETWNGHSGAGLGWEMQGWTGNDEHKAWLRSEGEREGARTHAADVEVFYGRPIGPWWDVLAGVRHDFQPGRPQTFAAIGVVGLAPYKFEVQATAYVGESGQTALRVEAEYETLITNRLVLQSVIEASAYGRDDEIRDIGSGLSTVEGGFRLRYEFTRRFAPYIGIVRERAFGRTARLRADEEDEVDDTRIVAGVRLWF